MKLKNFSVFIAAVSILFLAASCSSEKQITKLSGNKRIKHSASITRSPVVIGIKKSKADALGMTGKPLKIQKLVDLASEGKLRFLMSNPTQSNSGAMGYLGFLQGILGREEVLTTEDLANPKVKKQAGIVQKENQIYYTIKKPELVQDGTDGIQPQIRAAKNSLKMILVVYNTKNFV